MAAVLLLVPAAAYAHVTVNPSTAAQGDFTELTFRVPNETEDANTVQVEVDIPTDHPIAGVSVKPVPGWEVEAETTKLDTPIESDDGPVTEAVSKITWSGGTIEPGQYQDFDVSVGPLPDTDEIEFKALQTYDNGDVVRWIDEPLENGEEPEHPAPTLLLTAAARGREHGEAAASDSGDDDSNGLAIAALIVGGIALIVGGVALVMARKKPEPAAPAT